MLMTQIPNEHQIKGTRESECDTLHVILEVSGRLRRSSGTLLDPEL